MTVPTLPTPGASSGTWGTTLDQFLNVAFLTPEQYGAVGDGTTDDTTAINNAAAAAAAAHVVLHFAPSVTYKVTTLTVPAGSHWVGSTPFWSAGHYDLTGASGSNVLQLPVAAGAGIQAFPMFQLENFAVSGGKNQIDATDGAVGLTLTNIFLTGAADCGIHSRCQNEEWQFDNVRIEGAANYGLYLEKLAGVIATGVPPTLDKATFNFLYVGGCGKNGIRITTGTSSAVKWDHCTVNESGQDGVYLDMPGNWWTWDDLNTEGNGRLGCANLATGQTHGNTTFDNIVYSGGDTTGYVNGQVVRLIGAGPAAADLITTIVSGAGTGTWVLGNAATNSAAGVIARHGSSPVTGNTHGNTTFDSIPTAAGAQEGYANGQTVVIRGANADGSDLVTTISAGAGTASWTLGNAAGKTITGARATNAPYSDITFGNSNGIPSFMTFNNPSIGTVDGGLNPTRLRYSIDGSLLAGAQLMVKGGCNNATGYIYDPDGAISFEPTTGIADLQPTEPIQRKDAAKSVIELDLTAADVATTTGSAWVTVLSQAIGRGYWSIEAIARLYAATAGAADAQCQLWDATNGVPLFYAGAGLPANNAVSGTIVTLPLSTRRFIPSPITVQLRIMSTVTNGIKAQSGTVGSVGVMTRLTFRKILGYLA